MGAELSTGSRGAGATSVGAAAGPTSVARRLTGVHANASAPPTSASSMPIRNPPRFEVSQETSPSTRESTA